MNLNRPAGEPDIVLVGAGIMSATLGVFLKELEPALNVQIKVLEQCFNNELKPTGWLPKLKER